VPSRNRIFRRKARTPHAEEEEAEGEIQPLSRRRHRAFRHAEVRQEAPSCHGQGAQNRSLTTSTEPDDDGDRHACDLTESMFGAGSEQGIAEGRFHPAHVSAA
jgi:hypothetical protein